MQTARHVRFPTHALLFCALTVVPIGAAVADPPAGSPPNAAQAPSAGGFLSSLKQAFNQDLDREVVRGHFDLGTGTSAHRFYCLVDPKTGKRETNGVAGEPYVRKDGTTGIKSGAVSFESCVTAELEGRLVTNGYVLGDVPAPPPAAPAARAAPAAPSAATALPAPAAPTAPVAGVAPGAAADAGVSREVMATFTRFVAGQNAHDRAAVADALLDSPDFVWAQYGGNSIWGRADALSAFQDDWKGSWKLEPLLKESRISSVAADAAVLITPLLFTQRTGASNASPITVRWGGVFVRTPIGWRIASIFITPYPSYRPTGVN